MAGTSETRRRGRSAGVGVGAGAAGAWTGPGKPAALPAAAGDATGPGPPGNPDAAAPTGEKRAAAQAEATQARDRRGPTSQKIPAGVE